MKCEESVILSHISKMKREQFKVFGTWFEKRVFNTGDRKSFRCGDNWSLILQLSFIGWGCDTLGNLQSGGKWMFGHRREGDRHKGGLGSLAVHSWWLGFLELWSACKGLGMKNVLFLLGHVRAFWVAGGRDRFSLGSLPWQPDCAALTSLQLVLKTQILSYWGSPQRDVNV